MKSRLITSAIVWGVVLTFLMQILMAPNVMAKDVYGGSANGLTECDDDPSLTCSAIVTIRDVPYVLDVDNGDTVYFTYYIYWYDNRSANSPKTTHTFNITIEYPGRPLIDMEWPKYTYGDDSGSGSPENQVDDVSEDVTITVHYYADIDVNNGDCTDSDHEWVDIYLY